MSAQKPSTQSPSAQNTSAQRLSAQSSSAQSSPTQSSSAQSRSAHSSSADSASTQSSSAQTVSAHDRVPNDVVSVTDYWTHAQQRLDPKAWAYFSGGAGDGQGLKKNEAAFEHYQIMPRVLQPMQKASTKVQIAGQSFAYPIMLAPVAWQGWAHPQGERASAAAAAAMGALYTISMQSNTALEDIVAAAPQGRYWFQWYWQPEALDGAATQDLWQRCVAAGVEAIVLTVDAPVQGLRDQERRAGQQRPSELNTPHLEAFSSTMVQGAFAQPGHSPLFGSGLLGQAPTWSQVQDFIAACPLPVWLKGVLHPDDARLAVEVGAQGVIVSNHGGRQLAALPPAIDCLAAVVEAVGGQMPVLFDGGVRRGSDALIALGLGAQMVGIGRPYVMALAVAGAAGVAHVLHLLRTELEVAMALAGCARIEQIGERLIMPSAVYID